MQAQAIVFAAHITFVGLPFSTTRRRAVLVAAALLCPGSTVTATSPIRTAATARAADPASACMYVRIQPRGTVRMHAILESTHDREEACIDIARLLHGEYTLDKYVSVTYASFMPHCSCIHP